MERSTLPLVWGRYGRVLVTFVPVASTCPVPESGAVAGPVVGDHTLRVDAVCLEPLCCSAPEAGCRDGLLIVKDLGVHDAGAVIDCGVQVAVADTGVAPSSRCLFRGYAIHRRLGSQRAS